VHLPFAFVLIDRQAITTLPVHPLAIAFNPPHFIRRDIGKIDLGIESFRVKSLVTIRCIMTTGSSSYHQKNRFEKKPLSESENMTRNAQGLD
jgi:hypothetical protein